MLISDIRVFLKISSLILSDIRGVSQAIGHHEAMVGYLLQMGNIGCFGGTPIYPILRNHQMG